MAGIPFFEASGRNHEIGLQIGERFRKNIRDVIDRIQFVRERSSENFERACRESCEKHFPQYVEEIEGMAEGSGQEYGDVFFLQMYKEVLNKMLPGDGEKCTSVVFRKNGGFLLGHNEDGIKEHLGNIYVLKMETGQTRSISLCYMGILPGNAVWVNSHGLICSLTSLHAKPAKPGIPKYVLNRAMMDARNTDDFLRIATGKDKALGFHATLISKKESRALGIETTPEDYGTAIIGDRYLHTNHYVFGKFRNISQFVSDSSRTRYERVKEMVDSLKGDKTASMAKILSDHGNSPLSVCRHGDPSSTGRTLNFTLSSVTVDSSDMTMRISQGNPCTSECKTYSL